MSNKHIKVVVEASLGKRKVRSLSGLGKDVAPAMMSVTICPDVKGLHANIWINDDDGRAFGMVMEQKALLAFAQAVMDAQEEQLRIEGK